MLRKILLSTVLIAAAAGSAAAADLPYRTAAPAPYVAAPIFTWTGFYVGLNAGAAWNKQNDNAYVINGFGATALATNAFLNGDGNDVGFTGGAQVGYNMQFGSVVAGIEADINYLDRKNGRNGTITVTGDTTLDNNGVYSAYQGNGNNWFGTVRGRLGFAIDRFMPFVTGGFAFGGKQGGISGSYVNDVDGLTYQLSSNNSNKSTGWALGGGLEYAFSNSMSLKVEYLHVDLGSNTRTLSIVTPGSARSASLTSDNKFDIVRAGVNFRF